MPTPPPSVVRHFDGAELAHFLLRNVLLCLLYWAVAHLTRLYFEQFGMLPSPIWPAAAIALAAALRYGWSIAPGLYTGAVLASCCSFSAPLPVALGIGVMNTVGPLVAASLLTRSATGFSPFHRVRDVFLFFMLGAVFHAALAASGGVTSLFLGGQLAQERFFASWAIWWVADAGAVILFAPPLLAWMNKSQEPANPTSTDYLIGLGAIAGTVLIFFEVGGAHHLIASLTPLLIVPIAWCAVRMPVRDVTVLLLAVFSVAIAGTVAGQGAFDINGSNAMVTVSVMGLAGSITGLLLAALAAEQRRTKAALAESDHFNRELIESSHDCIKVLDREGRLKYMSHGGQALMEIEDVTPLLERSWIDIWPTEFRPLAHNAVTQAAAGGTGKFVGFCPTVTGLPKWWDVMITPIGDIRPPEQLLAVSRDITDRKLAEQALAENEREARDEAVKLATILSTLPIPVIIAQDPDCHAVIGNDAASALFGWGGNLSQTPANGAPAVNFEAWFEGRRLQGRELPLQRAAAHGRATDYHNLEIRLVDGRRFVLQGKAAPLLDDAGNVCGAVGAFVDISDRRAFERLLLESNNRLERINTELEQFAHVVAHDLRAPLRAVSQLCSCIQEDLGSATDAESNERMVLLRRRIMRMDNLINGLLAYSRLGYEPGAVESVPVAELVAQIMEDLPLPPGFSVEPADSLPTVTAHRTHLGQVLQNLIENATKHHDRPQEGHVWIDAYEDGPVWHFSIADDGPGIPEQFHDQIFRIFQTLEPRDQTEYTGIGLALVRKLVLNYGGSIAVSARAPRGSIFTFTWPKQKPETMETSAA